MANEVKVVVRGQDDASPVLSSIESKLGAFASQIGAMFSGLELKAVTDKLIEGAKAALEYGDNFAKMSQRTGVGTEQLTELAYAAKLSDVSIESLEKGIRKLQVALSDAAAGNDKAIASLRSVGVTARDSRGNIRQAADALEQIAEKFAATKDGTEKANAAIKLFGKAGAELIPWLNQGKEGLAALRQEAHRLGVTLTDEEADAFAQFNDNMRKMEEAAKGLMLHFVSGLIPALNDIAAVMGGPSADAFEAMKDVGQQLGDMIKMLVLGFESLGIGAAWLINKLALLADVMLRLATADFSGAKQSFLEFLGVVNDAVSEQLAIQLGQFQNALFPDGATVQARSEKTKDKIKRTAEDADKIWKASLEKQMEDQRLAADFSKSLDQLELQRLENLYKHQLVSVEKYYSEKKRLQEDQVKAEIYMVQQQLSLEEDALKRAPNAEAKIQLLQKQAQLTEQLTVLQAKLNALENKTPSGQADPLAERADKMQQYADQAKQLGDEIDNVFTKLEADVQAVQTAVDNHQISELEGEKRINALRDEAHEKLQHMVGDYGDLAASSGDPRLISNADKYNKKLDELRIHLSSLNKEFRQGLQSSFEAFYKDLVSGKWQDALKDFAAAFFEAIDAIIAKMLAMWTIEKLVGMIGPYGGGGDFSDAGTMGGGSIFGGDDFPTFAAAGAHFNAGQLGVVGEAGPELWVPDAAGTIVPFNKLSTTASGGTMSVQNHYEIDARGVDADRLAVQLRATEERAVSRSIYTFNENQRRRVR